MPDHGKPDDDDPRPPAGGALRAAGSARWVTAGVVAAVVVGVAGRLAAVSPLWLDEALSVNIASLPIGDIGEALRRDGHPPLYYWLLHGWMQLFGDGTPAVRALSVLLGVASLPLAWVAGGRVAGPAGARWAVVVLALSPYAVRYSSEARMYSLVMLLVLAGYLLVGDALRSPTVARLAGVAAISGSLLLSHYWSVFLLGVTGALLVARGWRASGPVRASAWRVAGAVAAGGLLFLPWLPSMLDQLADTGTPWADPSRPTYVLAVTLDDLGGGGWAEARLHGVVVAALLLVAVAGARRGGELVLTDRPQPAVRWELLVVVATLLGGATVAYVARSAYATRYAAVVVPLVLLAVAVGIDRLTPVLRSVAAGAVVVTSVVGIGQIVAVPRTEAGEIADAIEAGAADGDVVLVCPDQLAVSLERELADAAADLRWWPYPAGGDPRFVDWRDYEDRNRAADPVAIAEEVHRAAGDAAVWLVWNPDYRTFEGHCEALVSALGQRRAGAPVRERDDRFETAVLYRYDPAG